MSIIKEYDFILSIGRFCHTTAMLNNNGLKLFDGPWDWSGTGREEGIYKRLQALNKGFKNWFNFKDFVLMDPLYSSEILDGSTPNNVIQSDFIKDRSNINQHITNLPTKQKHENEIRVYNPSTMTYYGHDFFKNQTLKEQWPKFYSKYIRRCERTMSFLNAANSILLVYMNHISDQLKDVKLSDDKVKFYMQKLRKKYFNKQIDLYMFDHSPFFSDGNYQRSVIDIGIIRYISNHEDVYPSNDTNLSHTANGFMMPKSICNILTHIKLTNKFKMI